MLMTIVLPLLVALLGAFTYALAANPKLSEIGRLAFACGLLVTLFVLSQHVLHF